MSYFTDQATKILYDLNLMSMPARVEYLAYCLSRERDNSWWVEMDFKEAQDEEISKEGGLP